MHQLLGNAAHIDTGASQAYKKKKPPYLLFTILPVSQRKLTHPDTSMD